jgi:vitamin B12 transporter
VIQDHVFISNEQIRAAGQQSLAELLQQQAGFQIASYGDSGNIASVFTRGTNGNHTLLLVDGVRVELTSTGGGIWNAIPLSMIDHIEVVYGPESIYYGSDAVGGVVQIFTKEGKGAPKVSAMSGYGSYGTSMSSASISGSTDAEHNTKFSFGVSQENSSGYNTIGNNFSRLYPPAIDGAYPTGATGYQRMGAYGNLEQTIGIGQEIGMRLLASKNTYGFPSAVYNYNTNTYSSEFDNNINTLINVAIYSNNQINDNWLSNFQIALSSNYAKFLTSLSNDQTYTPTYDYRWQNSFALGQDQLQIITEHRSEYLNATYSTVTDGCSICNQNLSRSVDSLATIYHLKRSLHTLDVGIRSDGYSGYGSKLTGSATYGYQVSESIKTHLGVGSAFSEPTFDQLYYPYSGNPNLSPEYSKNIEWGLNYDDHHQAFGIVIYQNDISNLIQSDPSTFISYNIGKVRIQGMTLTAQKYIGYFNIHGSLDLLNPVDRNTDLALPLRAEEVGRIGADYAFKKIKLGANIIASSKRYATDSISNSVYLVNGQFPIAGYQMLSLNGSYQLTKRWSVFGRWDNVTNMPYQLQYGYNTPGSNVFFGVRYDQ